MALFYLSRSGTNILGKGRQQVGRQYIRSVNISFVCEGEIIRGGNAEGAET